MIPTNRWLACLSRDGRIYGLLILTRCRLTPAWQVLVTGDGHPSTWPGGRIFHPKPLGR